jgi:hypothetical protein
LAYTVIIGGALALFLAPFLIWGVFDSVKKRKWKTALACIGFLLFMASFPIGAWAFAHYATSNQKWVWWGTGCPRRITGGGCDLPGAHLVPAEAHKSSDPKHP